MKGVRFLSHFIQTHSQFILIGFHLRKSNFSIWVETLSSICKYQKNTKITWNVHVMVIVGLDVITLKPLSRFSKTFLSFVLFYISWLIVSLEYFFLIFNNCEKEKISIFPSITFALLHFQLRVLQWLHLHFLPLLGSLVFTEYSILLALCRN